MSLDNDKKYVFLGNVYEYRKGIWESEEWLWTPTDFQHFAVNGLVTEAEVTK